VGAEYRYPRDSRWVARAGLFDTGDGHDLTLGIGRTIGRTWRLDAAWQNSDPNATWSAGAGLSF